MRILTALLCIACTRAYMILPDFFNPIPPFDPPGHIFNEPGIDSYPHIEDPLPHVPNYPSYPNYPHWGYPKPHDPRPHHPHVPHPPPYYDHHPFYPHPPFDYPEPMPVPKPLPMPIPPKDNVPDSDEESNPQPPHQPFPYNPNHLKYYDLASTVENNLKVAAKFAADLKDDTSLQGPMTLLDRTPHYNALLWVLITLAQGVRDIKAPCADFDSYYDDNYVQAVEEYYPSALLDPREVSRKIQFYADLFVKKTAGLKEISENRSCHRHGYDRDVMQCDVVYAWFMTRKHDYYREGILLEALADLSAAYDQMSDKLMKISHQYLELPYLLHRKEDSDLKEFVIKFHRVFELMLPPNQMCQEYQDDWVAPILKIVPMKK